MSSFQNNTPPPPSRSKPNQILPTIDTQIFDKWKRLNIVNEYLFFRLHIFPHIYPTSKLYHQILKTIYTNSLFTKTVFLFLGFICNSCMWSRGNIYQINSCMWSRGDIYQINSCMWSRGDIYQINSCMWRRGDINQINSCMWSRRDIYQINSCM